jgi:hypothetical protein
MFFEKEVRPEKADQNDSSKWMVLCFLRLFCVSIATRIYPWSPWENVLHDCWRAPDLVRSAMRRAITTHNSLVI